MNKIIFFFVLIIASCNPLSQKTKIDSGFRPGANADSQIPKPTLSIGSEDARISAASGLGQGSQVRGEFEISTTGKVLKGSQVKASISLDTTEIR